MRGLRLPLRDHPLPFKRSPTTTKERTIDLASLSGAHVPEGAAVMRRIDDEVVTFDERKKLLDRGENGLARLRGRGRPSVEQRFGNEERRARYAGRLGEALQVDGGDRAAGWSTAVPSIALRCWGWTHLA